jgi:hypothetical protein
MKKIFGILTAAIVGITTVAVILHLSEEDDAGTREKIENGARGAFRN